jgi:lactate dehydrogenase-like 2-hydroxyacid dehydrogenase
VPELAEKSDFLVVAAPGGAETRHLVDAAVCAALGPDGYLVNVGRGSIVDTHALIDALRNGRLAGAALDVIDGEPEVPAALLELPNVVLTPHLAGRSLDAHAASLDLAIKNLDAHFSGRPLLTPVVDGSE